MQSLKIDELKSLEENLKLLFPENDPLIYTFEVVPLDYRVRDKLTPTLYISRTRLVFRYDDIFEVYALADLEFTLLGDKPKFAIWQQLFEGSYMYDENNPKALANLRESEVFFKLSMNEPNQVPKEFVLRQVNMVSKPYQTWAMSQQIINLKNGSQSEEILTEMTTGSFTKFNTKTMMLFIYIFAGYLGIKLITSSFLPDILSTVLDYLFGAALVGMLVWLVLSINNNLKRFETAYNSYKSTETPQAVTNQ